jgi:hypothetical protein
MSYSPMARNRTTTSTEATPYVRSLGDQILARVAALRVLLNAVHSDVEENPLYGNALRAVYQLYREHGNLVEFMSAYSATVGERLAEITRDALLATNHLRAAVPIQFTLDQRVQYSSHCEELRDFVSNWQGAVRSQLILAELIEQEQQRNADHGPERYGIPHSPKHKPS